jgi:site-specific recombinase XerD
MLEDDLLARFEEHIVGLGMSPATIANYLADIQNFCTWRSGITLGLLSLTDVSAEHIGRYCRALQQQGRSTSTINRRLQAVRKFYDYLVQADLCSYNPARDVERVSDGPAVSPHVLTADEVNKLLRAVSDGTDGLSRRDRAVLLLLLDTGIKVRELVDLVVDDIDLNVGSGYVWIGQDLQSGGRCLALGAEACAALRAYLRVRASAPGVGCVFVGRQGQPLSVRTVQRLVSSYARAAGLDRVSAQTLRYTFAHDALEERDLSEVARMLGLRDAVSARRYLSAKGL